MIHIALTIAAFLFLIYVAFYAVSFVFMVFIAIFEFLTMPRQRR
jgi:hypothetical protein